jgi:hypothetical protein
VNIKKFFGMSVCALVLVAEVCGLGLSTRFSVVTVEDLQPGQRYNVREKSPVPFSITNTSENNVELKIDVTLPSTDRYESMASAGFEPIPDVSWVTVAQTTFTIPAGQTVETDVFIAIPDENRYRGKRYQVHLHSHTAGAGFLAVGLNSTLRFTVASRGSRKKKKI